MKSFMLALAAAMMLFPSVVRSQDPTPAQIQAIETALTNLVAATTADQAAQAVVAGDSAALTAAQTQLAADTATAATAAAAVTTAIATLDNAIPTLTPVQARALIIKAAVKAAGPYGPHPYPYGPHPYYPQPTPYYPQPVVVPTPQPLPTPPAGYQYQLGTDGAWHLVPIIAAKAKAGATPIIPNLFPNGIPNIFPGLNNQPNGVAIYPGSQTLSNPGGTPVAVRQPGYWAGQAPGPYQWIPTR